MATVSFSVSRQVKCSEVTGNTNNKTNW